MYYNGIIYSPLKKAKVIFEMKRKELLKHLNYYGCILVRDGRKHSIFENQTNDKHAPVPRHPELKDLICIEICKEL